MDTRGFVRSLAIAALIHGGVLVACAAGERVDSLDDENVSRQAPAFVWLAQNDDDGWRGESRRSERAVDPERASASEAAGRAAMAGAAGGAESSASGASTAAAARAAFEGGATDGLTEDAAVDGEPNEAGPLVDGDWGNGSAGLAGGLAGRHALGVRRVGRLGISARGGLARGGLPAGGGAAGGSRAHGPRLQAVADPCHGMFPRAAEHDRGSVVVALHVTASGVPTGPRVIEEFPRGEGFAEAARACLPRLRFEPAEDSRGKPVTAESVVRLKFSRG